MVKHLHKNSIYIGQDVDKIVLIDDSAYKILPEEKDNLIQISTWNGITDDDGELEVLVTNILKYIPSEGDVRRKTGLVNNMI